MLVALVLAALVPVLGFAALVMRENARLQLAATERGMRDTASAVARTVDKELETAITALEALGQSEHLDAMNLAPFYELCDRVTRTQGWVNMLLFEADGRALMQTSVPLGTPRPPTRRPELFAELREHRRPAISNLFDGSGDRNIVAVYVPVVRDNAVRFVLTVGLRASTFGELLRSQKFAPDMIAVLQDRDATIIARTQGEAETVGRKVPNPSPGREGWVKSRVLEGTEVYVAFATAPLSGWRVVLTSPVTTVEAPLRRGAWQLMLGAAVASALAAAASRSSSGAASRARSAAWCASPARSSAASPREPLRSGVTEVNEVAEQLSTAAELARTREQETALRERQARAIADVAHALAASPDLDTVLRTAVDAVRGLVRADSARIALVDEAGRLDRAVLHRVLLADAAGLRDHEGPGRGRPRVGHRPAGAHRRLPPRSALPGQSLPADRAGRRHRVLHDGADRLLGRGGGRDLRQQLHRSGRSPTASRSPWSPSPTTRRSRWRRPGSSPPSTPRARRRSRRAGARTSCSRCSATSCGTRSPRSPPRSTCSRPASRPRR